MKESLEELLARKEMVNIEHRADNITAMSFKKGSMFFNGALHLIPKSEQDKEFCLFQFQKQDDGKIHMVFIKAYDSISEIIDAGWTRTDLN